MAEQTESRSSENAATRIDSGLKFHSTIDFDKRKLRQALREGGNVVIKAARRLVARRAISLPGEMPGKDSGTLARRIGVLKRGSRGGYVKVGVRTIPGSVFYPAVLFYGSKKRNIAPRGNYMVAALNANREQIRARLVDSLRDALVPR